jgi:Tubulin like
MAIPFQKPDPNVIPTLVIGLGGTGLEVLMQVRQKVQESYGTLEGLPFGFLAIDTQPDASADGAPPLSIAEKYWARVTFEEAHKVIRFPEKYPWVHQWLPHELLNKPELLTSEEGTGQVRACGRLAFFLNQVAIHEKCKTIRAALRKYESWIDDDLEVLPRLNIFVSLYGGTGSGMLIDLGYCLRRWFGTDHTLTTHSLMVTPDALSGTHMGLRMRENSYAALMEYNYFSDASTRYRLRYSDLPSSRIEDNQPPYDFSYLVGNSSYGASLKLSMIQEMMAQQIALDLLPSYAPHKRSLRFNIHQQLNPDRDAPPQGRSYPRNFLSFGIATLEVPMHPIRRSLGFRLAADLCKWWLHGEGASIPDITIVEQELKDSGLLGKPLRSNLLISAEAQPFQQIVQQWLQSITDQVAEQGWLECTAQLPQLPPFAQEKGKILNFAVHYLTPKIEQFRYEHFRDTSPDPDTHGDYVMQMYTNRDRLIASAAATLQYQLSTALSDRQQGAKHMQTKLRLIERSFNAEIERLDQEIKQVWQVLEQEGLQEYKLACSRMVQFRTQWAATKQEWMTEQFQAAIAGQAKAMQAFLERKVRSIAIEVLRRLLQTISQNKWRLERWITRVSGLGDGFWGRSLQAANQIDALDAVNIRLFHRAELDELYSDFILMSQGTDILCQSLTEEVLYHCTRRLGNVDAKAWFQLIDIERISEAHSSELERIVTEVTHQSIFHAPRRSKLDVGRDVCRRLAKQYPPTRDQRIQIEQLFSRSHPLITLDPQATLGRFKYITLTQAGLVGGAALQEAPVQQQMTLLQKQLGDRADADATKIAPLPDSERHQMIVVQEIGGFSLRCVASIESWRKFYQAWRGQSVLAERIAFKGSKTAFPIPVHMQNDLVFWDIIPHDPLIERLVVIARAFGILREGQNARATRMMVHYYKPGSGYQEAVPLAATWEETVQVLELPDCRNDRLEIQRQLTEQIKQAKTEAQRQGLRSQLETYLSRQNGGQNGGQSEDPRYLRQKTIVEKFMAANQLR